MRSVLIDPVAKTVTDMQYEGSAYPHIKGVFGDSYVDTAGAVHHGTGMDVLFVDDEGLSKAEITKYFRLPAFSPQPLAGKGVIIGEAVDGEPIDVAISTADILARIEWIDKVDISDAEWDRLSTITITTLGDGGESETVVIGKIERDPPTETERLFDRVCIPDSEGEAAYDDRA